jgi:DNA (cytosine-5)-methyltransferase 1
MNIELIELFSGIGGFARGFQNAGYNIAKHQFSEIDKHAIASYKYNFHDAEYIGSVTDVRGTRSDARTVITFGSPCQDFSLAGKQLGLEGQRSVLILEAIRIIRESRPSVFIWENVKGAFSSNNGADFWAILAAFANIGGYRLEWQLLNTSWFLPQNRERIYLVGHLDGASQPGVFPIRESDFGIDERATKAPIVRAITAGGHSGGHHSGMTLVKTLQGGDTLNTIRSGGRGSLTAKHNWDVVQIAHVSRTDEAKEIRKKSMKQGVDYTPFQGKKLEFKNANVMNKITCATQKDNLIKVPVIANCLTADAYLARGERSRDENGKTYLTSMHERRIRRLTEIECERLQGFPDDWTKYGVYDNEVKEISKTQRYKMCGNAVTTNVVKAIAERLIFL